MHMTIKHRNGTLVITGSGGAFTIPDSDEIGRKLCMLIEGECSGEVRAEVARRYGYGKARYFQLRAAYEAGGAACLGSAKRGPKGCYRRVAEVVRQIIRYRFLDHKASPEVIGQKLRQDGWPIGDRSVTRVITEYGLQKKGFTNAGPALPRKRRSRRTARKPSAVACLPVRRRSSAASARSSRTR
jgi:hypothetical protein